MFNRLSRKMGKESVCECGAKFVPRSPNQVSCDNCGIWHAQETFKIKKQLAQKEQEMRDRIWTQVRIWTSQDYSQEFLRGLIPR